MERIISKITLNISGKNAFRALTAKQYDNGVRFIEATITSDGTPISIQETDKIIANFRRPRYSTDPKESDYLRAYSGELIDGEYGVVKVPVEFWVLERSGEVVADISVINTGGETPQRVTTAAFTITVYPANYYSREALAESENYDALLMLFKEAEEYKRDITATAQGVIETALSSEAERRSEYETLKNRMEGVFNEAEISAAQAAQSADTAGEQAKSATSAMESIRGTVSECEAYLASEKQGFAYQSESASAEIENMVSDFKLWYERLPERGIDIGESYIDFNKLTTFKQTVNIDQSPTEPQHAVNKAYVDSYIPDRAMNAYRLNDTFGSLILYDEAFGIKAQSSTGGNWNEGIYVVSSANGNGYATLTCGDAEKRNLISLVCCAENGARHVDIVKDGDCHAIEFPHKDGTFALTSDLETYLTKDGIVNGENFVDFLKTVTFKTTVNLDAYPTSDSHAANKKYVDDSFSKVPSIAGKLDKVEGKKVVYANDGTGQPATIKYSQIAEALSIPQREAGGRLTVGEPVGDSHAATKGYVDSKLEGMENRFYAGGLGCRLSFNRDEIQGCPNNELGDGTLQFEIPLRDMRGISDDVVCLWAMADFHIGYQRLAPVKVSSLYDGSQTVAFISLEESAEFSYRDILDNLDELALYYIYRDVRVLGNSAMRLTLYRDEHLTNSHDLGNGTCLFEVPMYDFFGMEGYKIAVAGYVRFATDYERIEPVKVRSLFDGFQTVLQVEISNQHDYSFLDIYDNLQELVIFYLGED